MPISPFPKRHTAFQQRLLDSIEGGLVIVAKKIGHESQGDG